MKNLSSLTNIAFLSTFLAIRLTAAFELTFPVGPSSSSFWVSCKENILQWTFNQTDPKIFSVALYNIDPKKLNGNYQIANSVQSIAGSTKVRPNCVESGDGYFVGFVNASQYALNHPEIYYQSPTFSIQPNSSQVQTPSTITSQPSTDSSNSTTTDQSTDTFRPANAGQTPSSNQSNSVQGTKDGTSKAQIDTLIATMTPLMACISLYLTI